MYNQNLTTNELADVIAANQNNPEFMKSLLELMQTNIPSGNDAGLASSVNSEAKNASSDESTVDTLLHESEASQTVVTSGSDAGPASSDTIDVQNAVMDISVEETLFQVEEESSSQKLDEPLAVESSPEVNVQTEKSVEKKVRTIKPRETFKIARKYYTVEEVAEGFRIGKSTIHKYLKEGKIRGIKIGNQWRFSEEALNDFEKGLS